MAVTRILKRALRMAGLMQQSHPRAASARTPAGDSVETNGRFLSRIHTSSVGTRHYKLYIPASYCGEPMPAVVMLHGCTQDPEDFAAGTCMNDLADRQHFLVLYPAQSAAANGLRCWNWFNAKDQVREGGEPSLIARITHDVATEFEVDARRIFVAGMSAGAAMAVIVAETYPELFSAVGAHSGLPYRAAQSLSSAFGAMRRGSRQNDAEQPAANPVPTIVFHGDQDQTVGMDNGMAIVEQAVERAVLKFGPLRKTSHERASTNGRDFSVSMYVDSLGRPVVEQWIVHGCGHAWAGGSAKGSYTDVLGPHASAEMVRFFLAQTQLAADVQGAINVGPTNPR
jgi:poly(hydroxyalkanoate) depolymerase family esterase